MNETTQFCVGLEHKPGSLAELCKTLSSSGINIDALCVSDDENCCWVNMVATPAEKVGRVLGGAGYRFLTESVLTFQIDNTPGKLEYIATKLGEADVNINYVYGGGVGGSSSVLVLSVTDCAKAVEALGNPRSCEMAG